MSSLLEALFPLTEISRFKKRHDVDYVDRLNSRHSMYLFIILGIIVTTRQFVGDTISCWSPAQFAHEWTEYTNKICWISNTYYVPMDESIPNVDDNKKHYIAYYQWVPIMTFLQAMFFLAPSLLWKKLNSQSGIPVEKVVTLIRKAEQCSPEVKAKTIKYIARHLDTALCSQKEYRTGCFVKFSHKIAKNCCIIWGKRYGNYLVTLYMFVKLLYICNALGQLFLLNEFLGDGYYFYGYEVVSELISGKNWTTSIRFPRVTLCDFQIRALGDRIHDYTVQCALPINLFNEKIYIFVWFWLVFVSLATTLNLILWLWTLFRRNRKEYIRKYLKIMYRNFGKKEQGPTKDFYDKHLRQDGVFMLQLVAKNTNDVVVGELIQEMWEHFQTVHGKEQAKENV